MSVLTGSYPKYTLENPMYVDEQAAQFRDGNDFEESQDEEDDVDDSVKEDMKKLEDSFRGISDRFRLVNRIGEGTISLFRGSWLLLTMGNLQGLSLRYIKQKTFCTITIGMTGIYSRIIIATPGRVSRPNDAGWKTQGGHYLRNEPNLDMLRLSRST